MSNPMMDPARVACARSCLPTEDARKEFDKLCAMYPEAALFWDDDGQTVTLENDAVEIRITG